MAGGPTENMISLSNVVSLRNNHAVLVYASWQNAFDNILLFFNVNQ